MRLTKQYAYALLKAVPEEEAVSFYKELTRVAHVFDQFPEYIGMVEFRPEEFTAIRTILDDDVHPLVLNFLEVLVEDRMLSRLSTILEDYRLALVEADLLFDVKVMSANPLTEKAKERILNLIEARWGTDYMVDFRVAPKVLGGIKLEVNGAVIDTTFRSRIDQIIREVQHGTKR